MKRLLLALVASCNHYDPGSFARVRVWPGTRVALPCVDVAVEIRQEPQINGPVVTYSFGNRCDHDVTLDLAAARVVARDAQGSELALEAYDPRGEIRALAMPGRVAGSERIEYAANDGRELRQVCVDVGSIDRSAAANEHWICEGLSL